ncbi:hypothetical protein ACJX0J_008894 [Zea mays]
MRMLRKARYYNALNIYVGVSFHILSFLYAILHIYLRSSPCYVVLNYFPELYKFICLCDRCIFYFNETIKTDTGIDNIQNMIEETRINYSYSELGMNIFHTI